MSSTKVWSTKGGVLVTLEGPEVEGKVHCYRYPQGGFHGLLWKKNLRPANKVEEVMAEVDAKATAKPKTRTMAELGKSVDKAIDLATTERAQVAKLLEETRLLREEIRVARDTETGRLLNDLGRTINQGSAREFLDTLWGDGTVRELMRRIENLIGR